jgi:hypothetical protein
MSNVLGTFVLKFTMLVATFIPFLIFNLLCVNVDFTVIHK